MPKIQKTLLIPLIIVFCGVVLASFYLYLSISQSAGLSESPDPNAKQLTGYAWNSNFGWINFNGTINDAQKSPYRVSIDSNGLLSGYAWSENVGWVSFNNPDLSGCPSGTCAARITGFDKPFTALKPLVGWARILSEKNGWVSLSGTSTDEKTGKSFSYGAQLHSDGSLTGYAWSEDLGWISFEGEQYGVSIENINYPFPITIYGSGFKQGAKVSLVNENTKTIVNCFNFDQTTNDFTVGKDATTLKDTLTGHCPLYNAEYGNYNVRVTNPNGESITLSPTSVTAPAVFKVVPPTAADLVIVGPTEPVGNNGTISVSKISSSNSALAGAAVDLMNTKTGETKYCFTIHENDPDLGWITGKDSDGNVVPPMTCDLTDIEAGDWKFVVISMKNGVENWRDLTTTGVDVSCVNAGWDKPYTDADAPKLYGDVVLTDTRCKSNTHTIHGTCTPDWQPQNSCVQNFTQTANNCLNKPTRLSQDVGLIGAISCNTSGYKCQANVYDANYGSCVVDTTTCNSAWIYTHVCQLNNWNCGDVTDACGGPHIDVCGKCTGYGILSGSCVSNKCK